MVFCIDSHDCKFYPLFSILRYFVSFDVPTDRRWLAVYLVHNMVSLSPVFSINDLKISLNLITAIDTHIQLSSVF